MEFSCLLTEAYRSKHSSRKLSLNTNQRRTEDLRERKLAVITENFHVEPVNEKSESGKRQHGTKGLPETFPIPDYRNRARLARERPHRPKIRRTLHRSFGVTSQLIRRNPSNARNFTERTSLVLKPPHIGQVTSKTVIPWTWPDSTTTAAVTISDIVATEETVENESTTMSVLATVPSWDSRNYNVSSQSVVISDLLAPQSAVFNSTITLIKEFLKDKKKKLKGKRINRRKQAKIPQTQKPAVYASRDDVVYKKEIPQLKFKFIKSDKDVRMTNVKTDRIPLILPYSLDVTKKRKPQMEKITDAQTQEGSESIEEIGARIEAEEAERQRADGENPLKYMVKDGILFKRNKIPVARISLSPMETFQAQGENVRKRAKTVKKQTMVESSPFVSELRNLRNHAAVVSLKNFDSKRPIPVPPLSPPVMNLGQSLIVANGMEREHRSEEEGAHFTAHSSIPFENEIGVEPVDVTQNDLIHDIQSPPPYPFSHCYMNIDGFMCCNRYLESLMRRSFRKLRRAHRFHECSVQKIANRIQTDCENVFNTTFEVVVGIDDFAIRAHFAGDLMCKIQEGGRFLTAYATTMPTRDGAALDPLHVVTKIEMNLRDRDDRQMGDSIQFPERQFDSAVQPAQILDDIRRRNRAQDIPFHEKSREDIDNENIITRS
ncbi:hypothetical protein RB195_003814 [Necator americanus]|uniref:Ground-like domain-containing protein n=1 Tax=Necator americanus TaxID=51031 RepID=A0ABR1DQB7_NECAM